VRPVVREGTADDAREVIRLAKLLWQDMQLPLQAGEWEDNAAEFFRGSLDGGSVRLLVADDPRTPNAIVATGIGLIHQQSPAYWLPNGKLGYVQWFYTVPEWRKQGLASEILDDLITWFRRNEVIRVHLHSARDAVALYEAKGFVPSHHDNYWLEISD